ncbi:GntR family transcriptional regulator [Tepidibacillus infernus]|uniref:Phosphonate metabolism transcriptional regulator PhnF n=1 Tax=Tepidibacillus decaturensis TaxID=1413211 RepID=A0A135L5K8_9BACI|nr:GntR family transcriptional regulator [Tepidibacillus decaturensis]KXG44266.1 phosphonate metabolism transcriptional regulator PhnF [Tepidibacillus decaturensis]
MINKNSPLPIYYQLEEIIKEMIEKEELKPGDLIPSEREFSEKYEISRMTVRQAINSLVNDGYLLRKQGKGTYVARQKIEQTLKGLTSFSEDMKTRGMEPSTKLIDFNVIPSSNGIATKLAIEEGTLIYEVKRVRLADHIPMAYEVSYLPVDLVKGLNKEIVNGSLYEYIENILNMKIGHGTQVLEASIARKTESEILDIHEGAPVLMIQRYSYLEDGNPLEVVKSVYRADRYKFIIDMPRVK